VVLERSRDDLRCAGTAAVDQNDNGIIPFHVSGVSLKHLGVPAFTAFYTEDLAVLQKKIGHFDGLIENPPGIVTQV
jgi:hypothetical protein